MKKVFRLFDFENFVKKDDIFGNNDEVEENEILTLDICFFGRPTNSFCDS